MKKGIIRILGAGHSQLIVSHPIDLPVPPRQKCGIRENPCIFRNEFLGFFIHFLFYAQQGEGPNTEIANSRAISNVCEFINRLVFIKYFEN